MKAAVLLAMASSLSISYCAGESYRNPDHLSLTATEGGGMGSYDPEGHSSDEVRALAARNSCPLKTFARYEETPRQDGLVDFVGRCS